MTYHIVAFNNAETRIIMSKTETDSETVAAAAAALYEKDGFFVKQWMEG